MGRGARRRVRWENDRQRRKHGRLRKILARSEPAPGGGSKAAKKSLKKLARLRGAK